MSPITLTINGRAVALDVTPDTPLLWALRDHVGLHGTRFGCGIGACGACTVHVDGEPQRSCQRTVGSIGAGRVVTIEGLSADGSHPVQRAWREEGVPQCGYCQGGQILQAAALLARNPDPSDREIDDWMEGNLCRCGTYVRIRRAIHRAAAAMRGG